jgi:LmbE family N-acetylglucosaminyl deacetylase
LKAEPTMTEPLDVLAVGSHPDDLEITCGGTLAKLVRQGYRVGMIDLTSGEPTPRGTPELRAREAEAARDVLGVAVRDNLGLPNRVLMDAPEHGTPLRPGDAIPPAAADGRHRHGRPHARRLAGPPPGAPIG